MTDAAFDPVGHWDARYRGTPPTGVSWFEEHPVTSLELINTVWDRWPASMVDVGGGAAGLVEALLRPSGPPIELRGHAQPRG